MRNYAHMSIAHDAQDLERQVTSAGADMKLVLAGAKVHRATWDRWKAGSHAPRLDRWQAVQDAARDVINRVSAAQPGEQAA